jgi:transglutaminase-like putative cysteine protease
MNDSTSIKPQYIQGLTVLFWGFQTELWYFALPMALILEARYFFNRRWALTKTDFYRIADLTSIGLVAMVLFLFLNRQDYHFITTLISWLPILLFPLVTVLGYSTTPRMPLDVLFYSLRRQREPVQQSWDMDYVLLGACLLAAGLNRETPYYFAIAAVIIMVTLLPLRSCRFNLPVFILSFAIVLVSATLLHQGIRGAHLAVKKQTELWIARWVSQRTDPFRTRTSLGRVGQLKLSNGIEFRIEPQSGRSDFPLYLTEATYDQPSPTAAEWEIFNNRAPDRVAHADDYRWTFTREEQNQFPESKIYLEFGRERSLIPVPSELTELNELAAEQVNLSDYGTITAEGLIPARYYRVRYGTSINLGARPTPWDLQIPKEMDSQLSGLVPDTARPREGLTFIQDYFSDFRYTLFQRDTAIAEKPLAHFLNQSRAGHCEYFAAATVLMLRKMGIPARYVVGFSIQEWNQDLQMYIVRKRHAHAWAIAWVDDRWIVVDTTPDQWLAMEENASGFIQPVWDFLSNYLFLFQNWWNDQTLEDYETELYVIGAILALILIWRIATSEQVIISRDEADNQQRGPLAGRDSPFFKVESLLADRGFRRGHGELMTNWLLRIERPELLPMLTTHNRWRFDPHGISMEERERLATEVEHWLRENVNEQKQNAG